MFKFVVGFGDLGGIYNPLDVVFVFGIPAVIVCVVVVLIVYSSDIRRGRFSGEFVVALISWGAFGLLAGTAIAFIV